jgi:hypothetical protein
MPRQAAIAPEAGRSTVLTRERPAAPTRNVQETEAQPWPVPQAPPAVQEKSGEPPSWPAVPKARPRRRRWRGALSTLLTVAIAAGVGAYVWERAHETLKITSAAVAVTNPPAGCNVTANIVGTIYTNGRGGPISYEWLRGSEKNAPVLVADDASGSQTVQVALKWGFRGKGTYQAVAELRVLEPEQAQASTTFTYSCSR